jgi:DNA segregation ATPase FtsK/SpoIIIE, S-DNA-T family
MTATGVFPLDPVHLGIDENGEHVHVDLAERNMLLGGEPGGGKSNALNLIVAHGALSADGRLVLVDGKQVEPGQWGTAPKSSSDPASATPSTRSSSCRPS